MRYEACASLSWELVACLRQRISSSLVLTIIKASDLPKKKILVFIVRYLLPLILGSLQQQYSECRYSSNENDLAYGAG